MKDKEQGAFNVDVDADVIRLIDVEENPPEDFENRPCLIKYVNYDDVRWSVANAFHDDCFWYEDNSLPCGLDWVQMYAFLDV